MRTTLYGAASLLIAAVLLAGCGGGGGGSPTTTQPVESTRLEFPRHPNSHYIATGLPAVSAADARHMPIYSNGRHLMVGVDQGRNMGALPITGRRGDTTIRSGQLADGAGTTALQRYLSATVDDPALRWKSPPVVRFGGAGDQADYERVIRAVQLANAALPEGAKMRVASNAPSVDPGTGIYVLFQPDAGLDYWGITHNSNSSNTNQITHSRITVYKNYTSYGDRQATILVAHELLHALGMFSGTNGGHVPNDLNSILETGRDSRNKSIYSWEQGIPQPISLLYPADREAQRILYTRLRDGSDPTSFGSWASTSTHLVGVGKHSAFGVRAANGYGEPWAYGDRPQTSLADNPSLSGSVTWSGALLGYTPAGAVVKGDAAVGVQLSALTGTADFTALTYQEDGTTWLDGDLGYTIAVRGNTFRETRGDDGRLTGIFTGAAHEGVAGTLERDDLTAAFGGSR